MHILVSNDERLSRRVYYFEYRRVRFKLIQNNPLKHADVLLAVISRDEAAQQAAYGVAGEFLSALAWENRARVALEYAGGFGVPAGFRLRQAQCRVFRIPQIPLGGRHVGGNLSIIPHVETDQQRVALTLFREADSSNKVWLSVLFFWQLLEVGGTSPVGWIDSRYSRGQVHIDRFEAQKLGVCGRKPGALLQDNARHAIAHIRRATGRRPFRFDVREDNVRLAVTRIVLKRFAEYFVREELQLKRKLYLVRPGGRGFPSYLDAVDMRSQHAVFAYR
jgi:hypothetical protein